LFNGGRIIIIIIIIIIIKKHEYYYDNMKRVKLDYIYIIYPMSGIVGTHRNLMHAFHWWLTLYPYEINDKEACNIAFIWEFPRPLLAGNINSYTYYIKLKLQFRKRLYIAFKCNHRLIVSSRCTHVCHSGFSDFRSVETRTFHSKTRNHPSLCHLIRSGTTSWCFRERH